MYSIARKKIRDRQDKDCPSITLSPGSTDSPCAPVAAFSTTEDGEPCSPGPRRPSRGYLSPMPRRFPPLLHAVRPPGSPTALARRCRTSRRSLLHPARRCQSRTNIVRAMGATGVDHYTERRPLLLVTEDCIWAIAQRYSSSITSATARPGQGHVAFQLPARRNRPSEHPLRSLRPNCTCTTSARKSSSIRSRRPRLPPTWLSARQRLLAMKPGARTPRTHRGCASVCRVYHG